jgi:probable phosphoglycerate mutase
MATAEILLLRHAQSEGNEAGRFGGHGPTPLTALGRAQAAATARALASEGLSAIFSSDLLRAVQTAEPICAQSGIACQLTPALRERSVGVFTGLTFGEAEARYPEQYAALMRRDPDACPPDGETSAACLERAGELIDQVLARFTAGRTLLVSHAFTLNLLLRRALGVDGAAVFFGTDNCGLHRLRRGQSGLWRVEALNDRRHLVGVG